MLMQQSAAELEAKPFILQSIQTHPEKDKLRFVDRESAIEEFMFWYRSLYDNPLQVLTITGPKDVGKTSLLFKFERDLSEYLEPINIENIVSLDFIQSTDILLTQLLKKSFRNKLDSVKSIKGEVLGFGIGLEFEHVSQNARWVNYFLKYINKYDKHFFFLINVNESLGYDIGKVIKYVIENACAKGIYNFSFIVAIDEIDLSKSILKDTSKIIELKLWDDKDIFYYIEVLQKQKILNIPDKEKEIYVNNCNGSIAKLKKLINSRGN
jgi:hypothetical protein